MVTESDAYMILWIMYIDIHCQTVDKTALCISLNKSQKRISNTTLGTSLSMTFVNASTGTYFWIQSIRERTISCTDLSCLALHCQAL